MPTIISGEKMKKLILICSAFVFFVTSFVFAAENVKDFKEGTLTEIQAEARDYRDQGLKMQDIGDFDAAMKLYQKASVLDPTYQVVYNDLGIIYEAKGMADRAEESYLKCIKIDPYYLSAYSNLAILYENSRQLGKAAYCWKKRIDMGDPGDPWTLKARQRFEDIRLTMSARPEADSQEKEVVGLMKDVANEKYILRHDDKAFARKKLQQARFSYGKEDYATAAREALDAQYLDPDNKDIEEFVQQNQNRALTQ